MIKYTKKQIAELNKFYERPNNLVDLFEDSSNKWPDRKAIGTKNTRTKQYEWATYREIQQRIDNCRGGLWKMGLEKGDTVGIIVSNSVEWFVVENATHGLGGCFVAMYEKELPKTWDYIIKDSNIKCLFVRDEKFLKKVEYLKNEIETLQVIIVILGYFPNSMKIPCPWLFSPGPTAMALAQSFTIFFNLEVPLHSWNRLIPWERTCN